MSPRLLWLFLSAIPDLIKLLQAIDDAQKAAALNKKVNDDLKVLHTAITNKDAAAVTALFSGAAPVSSPPSAPVS